MGELIPAIFIVLVGLGVVLRWTYRQRVTRSAPILVLDGSNVMHWEGGVPKLTTLRAVIGEVTRRGYLPMVFFDANVGYKLEGRHISAPVLAKKLRLDRRQVRIVPSGEPADPWLIEGAIKLKARVISNDRFMDWRGDYPALRRKGFLVKGDVRSKKVELRL